MGVYTVAITGASGSVYGLRLLEQLLSRGHEVTLIVTKAGREVMSFETSLDLTFESAVGSTLRFLELPPDAPLRMVAADAMSDRVASGSHKVDAMVVCPASMGFCGSLAAGLASDVAERAADVMMKERRVLVVVPRETPLNIIQLRNLTLLAEAGAVVLPAMPAFYQRPRTLDDAVDFVVGKILDVLGVEHDLFERWGG